MPEDPQNPKEAIEKLLSSLSSKLDAGPGFERRVMILVAAVAGLGAFATTIYTVAVN